LLDAPVVVTGLGQPVLEVGAVEQAKRAGAAVPEALPCLSHHRVVAVDEGNGVAEAGRRRQVHQVPRARVIERQGLLADHVLAGFERGACKRHVQVVRSADVDDVHIGRLDERLGGVEGALPVEAAERGAGTVRRGGCDPRHAPAREERGPGVDRSDESRADYTGA
jgi:hypothetical protein